MRSDPFWEFGSFGCTGCHGRNLLHGRRADAILGTRLAFAQGGPHGVRLVLLTPPIETHDHRDVYEAKWKPATMPFRYDKAPLLIDNDGNSDFPKLKASIRSVRRSTWVGRFSSAFRSRCQPLSKAEAAEIIRNYERINRRSNSSERCRCYSEALPYPPPRIDQNRTRTYKSLLPRNAARAVAQPRSCRPSPKKKRSPKRC